MSQAIVYVFPASLARSHGESARLAEQFIRETCDSQGIGRDHLTIRADRGRAMISKSVAFLLADLGVTKWGRAGFER